jgi:DNA-binding CsgD family transcriptional regulator
MATSAADGLGSGRDHFDGRRWVDAHRELSDADRERPLSAADLELLAVSAYMVGLENEYLAVLERAYRAHLDAGEPRRATRAAFWVGVNLARRGEMGPASGWLGRARRLLDGEDGECVEHGYMLLPRIFELEGAGDWDEAADLGGEAMAIGERHGDADLVALLGHERGRCLIRAGRIADGLGLLDESMVAASGGELSPIVTGIVYCGVILACQEAHEPRRAREWTATLTDWCERQPEMVAFTGRCLIHRAELMQLGGEWEEALMEARRAAERSRRGENAPAVGEARYREGDLHRLRGDLDAAERAYREASGFGREPQPGLALLRLAQRDREAAAGSIRRVLDETVDAGRRGALLPAYIEIMLATGDLEAVAAATEELERLAEAFASPALEAAACAARGAQELATGRAQEALPSLRRSADAWSSMEAPYETARVRELIGRACRALGDGEAARLELDAARATFARLGAAPDLERLEAPTGRPAVAAGGLTDRELEVLRLVAAGSSNREIAAELVISEHTVARHLQNIFAKLGVSSRTAATAFAFSHDLI